MMLNDLNGYESNVDYQRLLWSRRDSSYLYGRVIISCIPSMMRLMISLASLISYGIMGVRQCKRRGAVLRLCVEFFAVRA